MVKESVRFRTVPKIHSPIFFSLAFPRPPEVDHHLGSPIVSLAEGVVNFGPLRPLRESMVENANLDLTLDNANNRTRGE